MMCRVLSLSLVAISLAGCLKTRADLRGQGDDFSQQKQLTAAQRERAKEVAAKPPPVTLKLDEHDEQLRNLNGRLDSVENYITQLQAAKGGELDSVSKERAAVNQRFIAYEEALKKLEAQVMAQSEELARLKAPAPTSSGSARANPKAAYDEAEGLFGSKKWKEAILSYQKYRDGNPKGKLYADATYKIGVCFQELGMKDEARTFYEELKEKFPASKEAKKAVTRLKTLK